MAYRTKHANCFNQVFLSSSFLPQSTWLMRNATNYVNASLCCILLQLALESTADIPSNLSSQLVD